MHALWPSPHPADALGKPSRKAATCAVRSHLAVLKGSPLRAALRESLQTAGKLGGGERHFAALATRELSRHQRLLDFLARSFGRAPSSFSLKEDQALYRYVVWRRLFTQAAAPQILAEVKLPGPLRPRSVPDSVLEAALSQPLPSPTFSSATEQLATRCSFPTWMVDAIAREVSAEALSALLEGLNREPEAIFRSLPASARDAAVDELNRAGIGAAPVEHSPAAFRISDGRKAVFETRLVKEGRAYPQDLGSQLIVELCRPAPEERLTEAVDLCAGAGGKTIGLADLLGRTRIHAWDLSPKRLRDARSRVAFHRLSNVSFPSDPKVDRADLVLIDAPCSGSGSLSREPDRKWKITPEGLATLTLKQWDLLSSTARKMKPGAALVYATCSVFRAENEDLIDRFLASHPDFHLEDAAGRVHLRAVRDGMLRCFPQLVPGGAFFAARLRRR